MEWRCWRLGAETYGAENQDVKTDPEDFYQSPFFNTILLIVLGVSVGGKGPIFIKIYLKMLVLHEKRNQNNSPSSLPCPSSSPAAAGKGRTQSKPTNDFLTAWNPSTTSHITNSTFPSQGDGKICFSFKIKMNNF